MSQRRTAVLMGVLLVLLGAYVARTQWPGSGSATAGRYKVEPLPGENKVSGLKVQRLAEGRWVASFDSFYTGVPEGALPYVNLIRNAPSGLITVWTGLAGMPGQFKRGHNSLQVEIERGDLPEAFTSSFVQATLRHGQQVVASQQVPVSIDWPDATTWMLQQHMSSLPNEDLLKGAIVLIDNGDENSLRQAKAMLERLVSKDPRADAAFVELARVAMKSNWGAEGLRQAESLLASALQIRPESANAHILLGYVHAHQGSHAKAEALFARAASAKSDNLWLWANWGELLLMQGKADAALQKFRKALDEPRSTPANDRARAVAYIQALKLLEMRQDWGTMEALHRKRTEEFGGSDCEAVEYAQFMLQQRGQTATAISLAQAAVDAKCRRATGRDVLGMAYYASWAGAAVGDQAQLLNQARVYLPGGPRMLALLAGGAQTEPALRRLVKEGEAIDQRDNNELSALAIAVKKNDLDAAKRLVKLGARTDLAVGRQAIPVWLLPVLEDDVAGVQVMQKLGVDYATARHQGQSALDYANRIGSPRLAQMLGRKAGTL